MRLGYDDPQKADCPEGFAVGSAPQPFMDYASKLPAPVQSHEQKTPVAKVMNPGDILSWVIHRVTGETPCGACGGRIQTMNMNGWTWCITHTDIIVGWLCEEAKRRGKEVDSETMFGLVKAAIKELWTDKDIAKP